MPDCLRTAPHADEHRRAPEQNRPQPASWQGRVMALRSWLRLVNGRLPQRLASFLLALTLAVGLPELLARGFLAA